MKKKKNTKPELIINIDVNTTPYDIYMEIAKYKYESALSDVEQLLMEKNAIDKYFAKVDEIVSNMYANLHNVSVEDEDAVVYEKQTEHKSWVRKAFDKIFRRNKSKE